MKNRSISFLLFSSISFVTVHGMDNLSSQANDFSQLSGEKLQQEIERKKQELVEKQAETKEAYARNAERKRQAVLEAQCEEFENKQANTEEITEAFELADQADEGDLLMQEYDIKSWIRVQRLNQNRVMQHILDLVKEGELEQAKEALRQNSILLDQYTGEFLAERIASHEQDMLDQQEEALAGLGVEHQQLPAIVRDIDNIDRAQIVQQPTDQDQQGESSEGLGVDHHLEHHDQDMQDQMRDRQEEDSAGADVEHQELPAIVHNIDNVDRAPIEQQPTDQDQMRDQQGESSEGLGVEHQHVHNEQDVRDRQEEASAGSGVEHQHVPAVVHDVNVDRVQIGQQPTDNVYKDILLLGMMPGTLYSLYRLYRFMSADDGIDVQSLDECIATFDEQSVSDQDRARSLLHHIAYHILLVIDATHDDEHKHNILKQLHAHIIALTLQPITRIQLVEVAARVKGLFF